MKRKIAAGLAAVIGIGMISGCGGKTDSAVTKIEPGEITYPIQTDATLKYWVRLSPALGTSVKNFGETPFAKKMMEDTGIKIEYQHPAQGQEQEVLNLLIASGELPDIIETDWLIRNPDSSIANKTIIALNDLIENQSPNLKKFLAANSDIDKEIKTDSGKYYVYPFVRNDEKLLSTAGFMMRKDWLDEKGLALPETIDEWDTVLAAMKDKCDVPLAMGQGELAYFCGAYNISNDLYVDGDKIKYGAGSDEYLKYLKKMNDWYQKGYIDTNFAIMDGNLRNSNMLSGKSFATFGAGGGALGLYLNTNKGKDYDLTAVPFPAAQKGQTPEFGNKQLKYSSLNGAAITAQSKNPELAARLLDYSYSDEGYMLNNFGIEGESYEMKDGYPTYTKLITENPDGLAMSQALPLYVRAANEGPFIQDVRYIEQYYALPQQQSALTIWGGNHHENHVVPQITMTEEETREYSKIMNEITTYRDEMTVKFIIGAESLDNYAQFASTLSSMNLARALEIKQAAYDRFLKR